MKFNLKSHCIYLDQFAVSELITLEKNIWKEIKYWLEELNRNNLIFCPVSFEHYIETSGKKIEGFKEHHDFLYSISSKYSIKPEIFITSQLISSRIRKNNITAKTFLIENYPQIENFESIYPKLLETKNGYNELIIDDLQNLNDFRKEIGQQRIENKTKSNLLNITKRKHSDKFIDRLNELKKDDYIHIRGHKVGNKEVPNWIDQIIFQLLETHKFNRKETDKLIAELEKFGFNNIPILDIRFSMSALISIYGKKETPSDQIDIGRICTALPISSLLFTDKKRKSELLELELDKKYNTKVFSGTNEDLESFLEELKKIN